MIQRKVLGRRVRALAGAGVLALVATGLATSAGAQEAAPSSPPLLLAAAAGGDAAVRSMSDAGLTEAIAVANKMSSLELTSRLRSDSTLRVSRTGKLFYVEPTAPAGPGGVTAQGPFPYADTFTLHSKPGSTRVIFLDFDGFTLAASNGWAPITSATGWDADGVPASFSNGEMDVIQGVWQRVAEDFAPFDVDVTTQDPGDAAITRTNLADLNFGTRAVITSDLGAWSTACGQACGGVAYLTTFDDPSFHSYYQPAWTFADGLGPDNEKFIAEATSHEVGHNLGLNHDGNAVLGYYTGHNPWAPIMGVGYEQPISQWSQGEYSDANNLEDDFVVSGANGLAIRTDEHGGTTGTATALAGTTSFSGSGIIASRTDLDMFSISQNCAGPISVTVSVAVNSPNLDAQLRVLNSAGTQIAIDNPTATRVDYTSATGLGATVTLAAQPAGTYYIEVDGVGLPTPPATGYSDYGSLGAYGVTGSKCNSNVVLCNGLAVTVDIALGQVPTAGNDVILGTAAANTIDGLAGNDTICGGAGADVLRGGAGADTLLGEGDNDRLHGASGNDTINGGPGVDRAEYNGAPTPVTVSLAAAAPQATGGHGSDTLTAIENVLGSSFDDVLTGDGLANQLDGGLGGNDTLNGGLGIDTLIGGAGNDTLNGGDGNDTLRPDAGDDTVDGGVGIDTISYVNTAAGVTMSLAVAGAQATGGSGSDSVVNTERIVGGNGADVLTGTATGNYIAGGPGADTLNGGGGNDTVNGDAGNDTISGGAGTDTCNGGADVDSQDGSCETIIGIP